MSFYKEVPGRQTTLESTLKFDTTPTAGSTNPVTSDGVANALGMSVSQQYVPGETYEIGAIVTHDGGLYINNYGTISDPDWVEEHWTQTSVGELIVSGMCEADTFAQFKLSFSKWGEWEKKDILVKPESYGDTTKNRPCRIALETTSTFFIYDFNVQSDMVGQDVIPVIDLEIEADAILDASTGLAI